MSGRRIGRRAVAIREFTCRQVVAGRVCGAKGQQTGGGPLREACDDCRKRQDAARKRSKRNPLRVVVEAPPVAEPPVSPPVPAAPLPAASPDPDVSVRSGVADVLAAVDVVGGTAPALRAAAEALAEGCDSPMARSDVRVLAAGVKELRAVLAELFPAEEVVDVDGSFLAGLSSPVRDASA